MACNEWKDEWIAHLYDELDEAERRTVEQHLEVCADCRATLDGLAGPSELLREAAPAVPDAPRVVVARPRPLWQPAWAFVAGLACASVLFSIGLWAGPRVLATQTPLEVATTTAEPVDSAALLQTIAEQNATQRELGARLARLEQERRDSPEILEARDDLVTRGDLNRALERVEEDQADYVRFLLGEITATERRAGTWIDDTRSALQLVALKSDPRISEQ